MAKGTEKQMEGIEKELSLLSRVVGGMMTEDYEAQHDAHMLINSALRSLHELKLELQPTTEEIPADVRLAA
jgi:hypothetical protein